MFEQEYRITKQFSRHLTPSLVGILWAASAMAADTAVLNGPGGKAVELNAASLSAMPVTEATSSYRSSKGTEAGISKGVLLWDLLQAGGLVDQDHKSALRHTQLATAGDGHLAYSV